MRVLVTGAAGFIGSHLTRALLAEGHEVRALDNLQTGQFWRIQPVLEQIQWQEGDITNPEQVRTAVEGMDAVLHQAALPSVPRSLQDPVASSLANVQGTIIVLQACREAGVRRLVYAGSSSAYGDTPTLPKVETMSPAPMSPYAVSKLTGEQYCRVFSQLGYVETVCFRYFNVFGPMQDPNSQYAAVIPRFITRMMRNEPITILGDGTQSRDFTYVENVVRANLLALKAEQSRVSGEVFNVGCGEQFTLNEVVAQLAEILGREPKVELLPSRLGDVPHSLADISKAHSLLGYEPVVRLPEALQRTAAWYLEQQAG